MPSQPTRAFVKARLFVAVLLTFSAAALVSQPMSAQETLREEQKAVVAFDLRIGRAMESEIAQQLDLQEVFIELLLSGSDETADQMSSVVRIFGALSAPPDVRSMMGTMMGTVQDSDPVPMRGGQPQIERRGDKVPDDERSAVPDEGGDRWVESDADWEMEEDVQMPALPMEFFVQLKFEDAAMAQAMFRQMREFDYDQEMPVNGKMMYGSNYAPENVRVHMPDETVIEMGTVNYLVQPDRRLFTGRLNTEWGSVPDDALRIAVDVDGARGFIDDAKAQFGGEMPMEAAAIVNLIDNISTFRMSADLAATHLLRVDFTGVDEAKTEELRSGLDALLYMGKIAGRNMVNEMETEVAGSAEVFAPIVDSLAATSEGTQVTIEIPRPEGFNEKMVAIVGKARERAQVVNRMNTFRQVALSIHNYHDAYRKLPFANPQANDELSWRVLVTPFMFSNLDIDPSKGLDTPENAHLLETMPFEFGESGVMTTICRIVNEDEPGSFMAVANERGTADTIMLLENPQQVHWARKGDLSVEQAMELFNGLQDGESLIAVRYDASTFLVTNQMSADEFRQMLYWRE